MAEKIHKGVGAEGLPGSTLSFVILTKKLEKGKYLDRKSGANHCKYRVFENERKIVVPYLTHS